MSKWLRKDRSGFTMIELMVVVIIVAILAAIAIPLYTNYIKNSYKTEATTRLGSILTAAKSFYQENNKWPNQGDNGFFADFTNSDNFSYGSVTGGGGTGAWGATATGLGSGKVSGATVTMACTGVNAGATFTYAGF